MNSLHHLDMEISDIGSSDYGMAIAYTLELVLLYTYSFLYCCVKFDFIYLFIYNDTKNGVAEMGFHVSPLTSLHQFIEGLSQGECSIGLSHYLATVLRLIIS